MLCLVDRLTTVFERVVVAAQDHGRPRQHLAPHERGGAAGRGVRRQAQVFVGLVRLLGMQSVGKVAAFERAVGEVFVVLTHLRLYLLPVIKAIPSTVAILLKR